MLELDFVKMDKIRRKENLKLSGYDLPLKSNLLKLASALSITVLYYCPFSPNK